MRLLNWFYRSRQSRTGKDIAPPPLCLTQFLGRSFRIPREGVVTVIGIHRTRLVPGQSEMLRVQVDSTGEVCLVAKPFFLANGVEIDDNNRRQIEIEETDTNESVHRIIGLSITNISEMEDHPT